VKDFLRDFDEDIDALKNRFKASYAASPEVIVLLRRGSDVELLEQTAKDVSARIKEDRPATTEVGQLLSGTGKLKETLARLSLPTSGGASWPAIEAGANALARAYGQARP
jgi:hypothetical protein